MLAEILDVKTLFVVDALITTFIGLALLFYWKNNKTYPGFILWVLSNFFSAIAYAAIFLRGTLPVWASILIVNGAFVLAGVLRLDGMLRFLRGKSMGRFYYSFPVVSVMLGGFFYFTLDNFIIRLVIFTAWTCILTWAMAVVFFRSASAESNYLYLTAGGISTIYGLTILVHTVFWMQNPSYGFFYNAGFQSLHFTSVLIYEIWFGMLIMMMNNQRLGLVLHKSKTVLKHHISELEKASSEIKILKGLLPICATCKKIRDEQGTWNNLESYIDRHSEAQFSHGICPDCAVTARKEINDFCNSLER